MLVDNPPAEWSSQLSARAKPILPVGPVGDLFFFSSRSRAPNRRLPRTMDPPEVTDEEAEASSSAESFTSTESFVLHHLRGLQIQISRLHRMQLFLADRFLARFERLEARHSIASCFLHWKLCVARASGPERVPHDSLEPQPT